MCTDWSVNYNILLFTHLSKEWNWTDWLREASPTAPRNLGSMRLGSTMISSEGALTRLLKISLTLTFFPLLSLSLTSWPLRTSEDKVDRASDTASGPVCASVMTEVFPSSKPTSRRLGDKPFSRSDWTLSAKKKKKKHQSTAQNTECMSICSADSLGSILQQWYVWVQVVTCAPDRLWALGMSFVIVWLKDVSIFRYHEHRDEVHHCQGQELSLFTVLLKHSTQHNNIQMSEYLSIKTLATLLFKSWDQYDCYFFFFFKEITIFFIQQGCINWSQV